MEKKVSVIIPAYNVEKYIKECLQSVVDQTLKDIEIICIDDCSSDRTLDILRVFAKKDSRILVLQNDENKGLSATRNRGLLHAKGKYVYFLDSDDMIESECLELLYRTAEDAELEGIFFDYQELREYGKERFVDRSRRHVYEGVFSGLDLMVDLIDNDEIIYGAPLQFWNRQFLQKHHIDFYEAIYREDILFTFRTLTKSQRVRCIGGKLYRYRIRKNSTMTSQNKWKHFEGLFLSICEMLRIWNSRKWDERHNTAVIDYISRIYNECLNWYIGIDPELKRESLDMDNRYAESLYRVFRKADSLYAPARYMLLDKCRLEVIRSYHIVILYGAGRICRKILSELDENGIGNIKIAVSSMENEPLSIMGNTVYEIGNLDIEKEDCIVILAVGRNLTDEMKENLRKLKFEHIMELY